MKDLREPTAKMGKSGADGSGVVFLLDTPDAVAAKVRRAVTDTEPELTYLPAERPGVSNLAHLRRGAESATVEATRTVDAARQAIGLLDVRG